MQCLITNFNKNYLYDTILSLIQLVDAIKKDCKPNIKLSSLQYNINEINQI